MAQELHGRLPVAEVYVTPASGVGGEFPTPVPFYHPYTRRFVENYMRSCQQLGQQTRVVWHTHAMRKGCPDEQRTSS